MNVPLPKTSAALALAALLSACGGGGGDSSPGLQISGTAATGAALAGGTVSVKCAAGSGTATADDNGRYTLTLTDGRLPCMVRVTGDAKGTNVTLHSVVEKGESADGRTTAVAHVTPLTEMILAQLAAALPASLFDNFGSANPISPEQLARATRDVLAAISQATGIETGEIDPFKTTLVAATSADPNGGNDHDRLLDKLGATVPAGSLAVITSRIAKTGGADDAAREALKGIFSSAHAGEMPGCPTAKSGPYRVVDYFGRSAVQTIDFKSLKFKPADGSSQLDIAPLDPAKPCEFKAAGTPAGVPTLYELVMGPYSAGAYRLSNPLTGAATVGHIFPVQSITVADVQGVWNLAQSGYFGDTLDRRSKLSTAEVIGTTVEVCDYGSSGSFTCVAPVSRSIAPRSDGGLDLIETSGRTSSVVAQVYGFRASTKALTLYGTTNAADAPATNGRTRAHFVAGRPVTLSVPAVDTVQPFWNAGIDFDAGGMRTQLTEDAVRITGLEGSGVVRRVRSSDGRPDRLRYNDPIFGVRLREGGVHNGIAFSNSLQIVTSTGIVVSIDEDRTGTDFYFISVVRP